MTESNGAEHERTSSYQKVIHCRGLNIIQQTEDPHA